MANKLEEIVAVYRKQRQRWDDTVLIECDLVQTAGEDGWVDTITIKTTAQEDELDYGLTYRFYGKKTTHPKYGDQFVAQTFVRAQPHGQHGTIRYLMDAPHIGHATATALWKAFQGDAVRIVRESPEVAAAAVGGQFSDAKAVEAGEYLNGLKQLEGCTIDLTDLLTGRGFPRDTGKKAVKAWGNKAAEFIRKNPYLLMKFRGCGFTRCDDLYKTLGGDLRSIKRQALCAWYVIARDREGHTWFTNTHLEKAMAEKIGHGAEVIPATKLAKRARMLGVRRDDRGGIWISEKRKANNEETIATKTVELLTTEPTYWPDVTGLDVSDHQRQQLATAIAHTKSHIAVFSGCPGTGKTYSVARLIGAVGASEGWEEVAVCCPTGKAAARITEAMQGYGLPIRARTIHGLLGVATRDDGDGWGFDHNENNPLPFRYIFVDEASMPDADILSSLMKAMTVGSHLMLVGDTNQLPPVGHGAPLRDLIAAGVPMGELREIRRNAGSIVQACASIRDGRMFTVDDEIDIDAGKNLRLLETRSGGESLDRIVTVIKRLAANGLVNPIWDCQVIVAVNAKSDLSRKAVNERLQAELNPNGIGRKGIVFRTGDKIVCLKNGLLPTADTNDSEANKEELDGKVFVANGEIGRVLAVEEKIVVASFDAPKRVIKIILGKEKQADEESSDDDAGGGCNFDLAYAISCHKSQGSEFPVVFVVLDEYAGARMVCSREWLYTAISRAKKVCFLVGKLGTAESMIRRQALHKRKTFLREIIEQKKSEIVVTHS